MPLTIGFASYITYFYFSGFDANIPGYTRYSMNIDASKGMYNLRIHNVQMDDEAEFQCQVKKFNNFMWKTS